MILTDCRLWLGSWDLSADHNELHLGLERAAIEDTAFLDAARSYEPGLTGITLGHHGWVALGANKVDDALFQALSLDPTVITVSPDGVVGNVAYFFQALAATYEPGGRVGEMFDFSANAQGKGGFGVARGFLQRNSDVPVTANGQSAGKQFVGGISASERIAAALHVVGPIVGTSIQVDIESDDNVGFTTPTTRGSFTLATGITAQAITIDGPFTDDYWRAKWTVVGGGPSFPTTITIAKTLK